MINMGELFAYPRINNPSMELVELNDSEKETFNIIEGDLLFARQSLVLEGAGKCSVVIKSEKITTFESHLIRVRLNKNICEPLYYFYYFKSQVGLGSIQTLVNQVSAAGIRGSDLEKLKIIKPPLIVQRKIAAILSAYDDLIENCDRRITLLEKMAEEIYREWFVRLRFPGHEQTTFHKGIPEGWNPTKIETLCKEIRQGVNVKNLSRNTKYLGLEHLPRKSILIKEYGAIDSVKSNKLLFKERDILFGKIRPYLHKIALANFFGACSSDTIVIRPKQLYYEGFLLFTIFSDTFIELATISSKGTKMPRADWDFLKKLEIVLPSHELLEKYQVRFDAHFSLMSKLSGANEILKQTRDRLLTRLISGKLSVEDLDIQFPPSMIEDLPHEQR